MEQEKHVRRSYWRPPMIAKSVGLLGALIAMSLTATAQAQTAIAHWSFDDINGSNQFEDDSGNGYHATIAAPDTTTGSELKLETVDTIFGAGAANFDRATEVSNQGSGTAGDGGPGAYAEAPHITHSAFYDGSHTVAAWVKVNTDTSWSGLVGDWANEPYETGRAYLYGFEGNTEKPMITLNNVDGQAGPINFSASGTGDFTKDVWHHVVWSVNRVSAGQSDLSIFVDGVLFNSATWTPASGNADIRDNTLNPTWIGLKEDNGLELHALVDELWIIDGTLSANQMASLMNNNVIPEPATLSLLALGGLALRRRRKA